MPGKVGNTGNSPAPHLHFHVVDGPSPLLQRLLPPATRPNRRPSRNASQSICETSRSAVAGL